MMVQVPEEPTPHWARPDWLMVTPGLTFSPTQTPGPGDAHHWIGLTGPGAPPVKVPTAWNCTGWLAFTGVAVFGVIEIDCSCRLPLPQLVLASSAADKAATRTKTRFALIRHSEKKGESGPHHYRGCIKRTTALAQPRGTAIAVCERTPGAFPRCGRRAHLREPSSCGSIADDSGPA